MNQKQKSDRAVAYWDECREILTVRQTIMLMNGRHKFVDYEGVDALKYYAETRV